MFQYGIAWVALKRETALLKGDLADGIRTGTRTGDWNRMVAEMRTGQRAKMGPPKLFFPRF